MIQPTQLAFAGLDHLSDLSSLLLNWASPERSYLSSVLSAAALKSADRLLDVGCGSGDLLAAAAILEPGALLYGIDPDEDALELASRKIYGTLQSVELHQAVAESLPFESDFFDIVTATLMVGSLSLTQRREMLAECFRVLAPGGRLLIADWAASNEGLRALLAYPNHFVRWLLFSEAFPPTLEETLLRVGFHPPETRATFWTVLGTIELIEVFKPLQG
ncbi:MAG: class I SAM-dependent methyltransferase [Deltaproteobacteria bacterium]|nr:class I SAM-dependent methyltransferase [Deltaproteobacteria bacterium]